jgi:A/G-specific adenine glycosylase
VKRISSAFATSFRTRLLGFYDDRRRKLPWRQTSDPYCILVSEVMLQQTRVDTVIPYYERWIARFPDVHALATAHADDVLKMWEGLGYYSRARNLQRAAQMVRERYHGSVPATYDQLNELPGIGAYTAAAVSSIAFDAAHAAVDGNVKRVLARIFDLSAPLLTELQAAADKLLDHDRPGDFNQAMMELGATVCTPRKPACAECPVARSCTAFRKGTVHLRPARKKKALLPEEHVNTLVALHAGEMLVVKRPARGLLAGLWEFPEIENTQRYDYVGSVPHTFTHKRIIYRVYTTQTRARARGRDRQRQFWLPTAKLADLAFSTAQRKLLKLALPSFGL